MDKIEEMNIQEGCLCPDDIQGKVNEIVHKVNDIVAVINYLKLSMDKEDIAVGDEALIACQWDLLGNPIRYRDEPYKVINIDSRNILGKFELETLYQKSHTYQEAKNLKKC